MPVPCNATRGRLPSVTERSRLEIASFLSVFFSSSPSKKPNRRRRRRRRRRARWVRTQGRTARTARSPPARPPQSTGRFHCARVGFRKVSRQRRRVFADIHRRHAGTSDQRQRASGFEGGYRPTSSQNRQEYRAPWKRGETARIGRKKNIDIPSFHRARCLSWESSRARGRLDTWRDCFEARRILEGSDGRKTTCAGYVPRAEQLVGQQRLH